MGEHDSNEDFTPQEARDRFEATLRGALKAPPQHRETPKKPAGRKGKKASSRASGASAGSAQRRS